MTVCGGVGVALSFIMIRQLRQRRKLASLVSSQCDLVYVELVVFTDVEKIVYKRPGGG